MDTSFWSQRGSVFSGQFSVFSQTTESTSVLSSRKPSELLLPTWIGADGVRISWVTTDSLDRDDRNVTDTEKPEPLVGAMPESAVNAWNRIRLAMAIAPFKTLIRPTCEDRFVSKVVRDGKSSESVFRHVGALGRRYDADEPQLYVRPRGFAPTLGRFLPCDPR